MESAEPHLVLPQLQLDDLLGELQSRLQTVRDARDRVRGLLEAVIAVGSDLQLDVVLRRIVEAAVRLVDARYGALGVVGRDGRLADFIPVGLDEAAIAGIDHWPEGHGVPAGPSRTAVRSWSGQPAAAGRSCAGRCRCPRRPSPRSDYSVA